ncbi:DUF927 domain-containing protein [Streptomyces sp. NPDC001792]|uniref:DUF927 domain-containing protein n=1 Tax=Streptomyces sp. NPDC001792 TaxID=3154524 RepID=UPI003319BCC8
MSAHNRVKEALQAHGSRGRGAAWQCPAHDDRTASLSVGRGSKGVVLKCQAGCSTEDVVAALGLTMRDLFDEPRDNGGRSKTQWIASYEYTDERGAILFVKERGEPKTFRIYKPLTGGRRQYRDVFAGSTPTRRVLYRLPQVLAAVEAGEPVYVCEGEKDVHAAERHGAVATCNYEGAAKEGQHPKWRPEYGDTLKGAHVVIVADNDEAGYAHARAVLADLTGKAASVRVVRGLVDREKADLSDHLAAGHSLADLVDVDLTAAPREAAARHLRAVPSRGQDVPPTDGANALADEAPADDEPTPQVGFQYSELGLTGPITTPTNYRIRYEGVDSRRELKDGDEQWTRITFAPVVPTASYEDPDGNQSVRLSWLDYSRGRGKGKTRVVSRVVSRAEAKRGKELIKQLGGAGFPAVEGSARHVELWLATFEAANVGRIPAERLARWLGWQPDGTFISSPDGDVTVEVAHEEQRSPAKAHRPHGSLAGWQDAVRIIERLPVPRTAVAAGFAASLLNPLGVDSFTVDYSSRSTGGKTTTAQGAMSVWANPSVGADAMANWRTTLAAIEKRLNLVRGLVTVLDETMAVNDVELIKKVLYQIPMNHGAARSGGYASMLPWQTIVVSTGEQPIQSFTRDQGTAARVLELNQVPFGENGGDAAVRFREGVLSNYGVAGPAFIEWLLAYLQKADGVERLRDRFTALKKEFQGDNPIAARRAPLVAILALGERLAHEAGVLPYEPLTDDLWRSLLAQGAPTDNRPEMALDVVREFVASHPSDFHGMTALYQDQQPTRGWAGALKRDRDGDREYVAFLPERLKEVLDKAGYKLDAVVEQWADAGHLRLAKPGQRPRWKTGTRIAGRDTTVKCVCVWRDALDGASADADE